MNLLQNAKKARSLLTPSPPEQEGRTVARTALVDACATSSALRSVTATRSLGHDHLPTMSARDGVRLWTWTTTGMEASVRFKLNLGLQ